MHLELEEHLEELESLHMCPVCAKIYLDEKGMYQHIMRAHQEDQRLAYDLRADLYKRWQERVPRHQH